MDPPLLFLFQMRASMGRRCRMRRLELTSNQIGMKTLDLASNIFASPGRREWWWLPSMPSAGEEEGEAAGAGAATGASAAPLAAVQQGEGAGEWKPVEGAVCQVKARTAPDGTWSEEGSWYDATIDAIIDAASAIDGSAGVRVSFDGFEGAQEDASEGLTVPAGQVAARLRGRPCPAPPSSAATAAAAADANPGLPPRGMPRVDAWCVYQSADSSSAVVSSLRPGDRFMVFCSYGTPFEAPPSEGTCTNRLHAPAPWTPPLQLQQQLLLRQQYPGVANVRQPDQQWLRVRHGGMAGWTPSLAQTADGAVASVLRPVENPNDALLSTATN